MKISLSKPYVDKEIKERVLEVIDSGQYILGNHCKDFEKEFARFIGVKACCSHLFWDISHFPMSKGPGGWTWGRNSGSFPHRFSDGRARLSCGSHTYFHRYR